MEDYMLPCLNKELFGLECLGCGIQRATVLFFRGDFAGAFHIYPAIYLMFLLLLFLLFNFFTKFKYDFIIKVGLISVTVVVVLISYFYKMFG